MKKNFVILLMLFTALNTLFAQTTIPNSSFENWDGSGASEEPTNWNSNKSGGGFASSGPQTCFKESSNPHSGTFCAKVATGLYLGSIVVNGSLTTGRIEAPTTNKSDGYIRTKADDPNFRAAFIGRPDSLVFWLKYTPAGSDRPRVEARLHRGFAYAPEAPVNNNHPDSSGNIIARATFLGNNAAINTWTRISVPFVYVDCRTPQYILITMTPSHDQLAGAAGSTMYVDDFEAIYGPNFAVTVNPSNVTMVGGNNGSAAANVAGGKGNLSYLWSNNATTSSISNLIAGQYCVTITDGVGCTTSACASVTEPSCAGFSVSVGTTNETLSGNDGTATANVTGGSSLFTYSWSPGGETTATLTSLSANTYCVTVTDGVGCTATGCGVVSVASCGNFSASVTTTDATTVGGNQGSATASPANGTMPYTYLWSNAETTAVINGLTQGTYSVTVTDSLGCQTIASGIVGEPGCTGFSATTNVVDASGASVADGSATATPTGGISPYNYAWSNNGTTQAITVVPGTYTVTVTDAVGCTTTASATVSFTVGINDAVSEVIKIYPNPARNMLTVELNNADAYVFTLYDLSGRLILNQRLSEKRNTIELNNAVAGIYVYTVKNNADGKTVFGKLSIQ